MSDTNILLIKFSRTNIRDYCWLIKAENINESDYCVLEKIFSEYKLRQISNESNDNCGLIELTSYFCFFSCYKTTYTDNYDRSIFALDALCIEKERIDIICSLYFIIFSNPQKYIQHNQDLIADKFEEVITNYTIDITYLYENYLKLCQSIDKEIFLKANFYPTFRGFNEEMETKLLKIVDGNNVENFQNDSGEEIDISLQEGGKQCILSVVENRRILFGKYSKFTIKGDFGCRHNIIYIEKIFSSNNDLHNFINDIIKWLDEYTVTVNYSYIN